jgi:hypothetical protein
VVDNTVVIGFGRDEGRLVLSLDLRDRDNQPILTVHANELVLSTDPWDVEFVGQTLTLRQQKRDLLLVLKFVPPSSIFIDRTHFFFNGVEIEVNS